MKIKIPFIHDEYIYIEIAIKPKFRSVIASILKNDRWLDPETNLWMPNKIKAIKFVRSTTKFTGLVEAKNVVEDVMKEYNIVPVEEWDSNKVY